VGGDRMVGSWSDMNQGSRIGKGTAFMTGRGSEEPCPKGVDIYSPGILPIFGRRSLPAAKTQGGTGTSRQRRDCRTMTYRIFTPYPDILSPSATLALARSPLSVPKTNHMKVFIVEDEPQTRQELVELWWAFKVFKSSGKQAPCKKHFPV
jgi:hypothetical protein